MELGWSVQPEAGRVPMLMRAVVVLSLAALLLWVVITTGIAHMFGQFDPRFAHDVRPQDARAAANLGKAILFDRKDRAGAATARTLAEEAVRRDPTVIAAYSTLGLAADVLGDPQLAERTFSYSHRLSRRDIATQLWLIETNVAREDVAGALDHFDAAISTTAAGWTMLTPILLAALDDDRLVAPIARLAARNRWWSDNFEAVVANEAKHLRNATRFFVLTKRAGGEIREDRLQSLADRLVTESRFADAKALDALFTQRGNISSGPRDGGFDQPEGLTPFRWELGINNAADVQRSVRSDRTGDTALFFVVDNPSRHVVARQLIDLAPGRYVLSAEAQTEEAEGDWIMDWSVACPGAELGVVRWTSIDRDWSARRTGFTVPAGCGFQWVSMSTQGGPSASRLVGWSDNVAIRPVR